MNTVFLIINKITELGGDIFKNSKSIYFKHMRCLGEKIHGNNSLNIRKAVKVCYRGCIVYYFPPKANIL